MPIDSVYVWIWSLIFMVLLVLKILNFRYSPKLKSNI